MPATLLGTLRAQAYNNGWSNHRLHAACARLSRAEFEAPRTGFFPSIRATLDHILVVDRFYVDALEGGRLGPAAWADPEPCWTMAELALAQAECDRRLVAWCEALDDADRIVAVHRTGRVQHERAYRLLLHLFQHAIHHRGQIHCMLSGTGVRPPQLDEFFSVDEAPLREAEFAALGWTEERVWGEPIPGGKAS